MTCQFCKRAIRQPGAVRYGGRDYHEPCFAKLRAAARATGGIL